MVVSFPYFGRHRGENKIKRLRIEISKYKVTAVDIRFVERWRVSKTRLLRLNNRKKDLGFLHDDVG